MAFAAALIPSARVAPSGSTRWRFLQNAREAKVVVVAEVTRYLAPDPWSGVPTGFEANVNAVVKGADTRKTIVFRTGFDGCAISAAEFPIGTLWALILRPQDPQGDFGMCETRQIPVLREKLSVPREGLFTTEQLRARLARD